MPNLTVGELKAILRKEVASLFRVDGRGWKAPIAQTVSDLRTVRTRAFVFGGTLRSLLVSRVFEKRPGRPRDIDLVISASPLELLEKQLHEYIVRRTRFGGLHLARNGWTFDIWPIDRTWAFQKDRNINCDFADLPFTTPFDTEAIAVEVTGHRGHIRDLCSGNDQFFRAILSRTIELNRDDNPFPKLTVVRALIQASELGFRIGRRLGAYIADCGRIEDDEFESLQKEHYGFIRLEPQLLQLLSNTVHKSALSGNPIELPRIGQLFLIPDCEPMTLDCGSPRRRGRHRPNELPGQPNLNLQTQ